MTKRKAPTVPLYVRIPADLRARIDAGSIDPARPWITQRLQDTVIEALYKQFPNPPPPEFLPAPMPPPVLDQDRPTKKRKRTA